MISGVVVFSVYEIFEVYVKALCVDVPGLRFLSTESLYFPVLYLVGLLVAFGRFQHMSAVWLVL